MSIIGKLSGVLGLETKEWEDGFKKGAANLSKFEQESLKRLKSIEKAAAQSRLDKALGVDGGGGGLDLEKIIKVGAIMKVGRMFNSVAEAAVKFREEAVGGAKEFAGEMLRALPVLGDFIKGFDNAIEAYTGAKQKMAEEKAGDDRAKAAFDRGKDVSADLVKRAKETAKDLEKQAMTSAQQQELANIEDDTERQVRALEIERDNRINAIHEQTAKALESRGAGIMTKEQANAALNAQNDLRRKAYDAEIAITHETESKKGQIWEKQAKEQAKAKADEEKKVNDDAIADLKQQARTLENELAKETKATKIEATHTSSQLFKGGLVSLPPNVFRPMTDAQQTTNAKLEAIYKEMQKRGVTVVDEDTQGL
jgi:hypothetical protein